MATPFKSGKKFKQKCTNYEIATGVSEKEQAMRVATFLTGIGEEAVDVYNTLTWDEEGDNLKIYKILEKFDVFCNPKKKHYLRTICILFKKPGKR